MTGAPMTTNSLRMGDVPSVLGLELVASVSREESITSSSHLFPRDWDPEHRQSRLRVSTVTVNDNLSSFYYDDDIPGPGYSSIPAIVVYWSLISGQSIAYRFAIYVEFSGKGDITVTCCQCLRPMQSWAERVPVLLRQDSAALWEPRKVFSHAVSPYLSLILVAAVEKTGTEIVQCHGLVGGITLHFCI